MSRTDPERSNQPDEAAPAIERGWITVSMAAKYAGLSADTLRRAIWAGELEAYEKPVTYPERRTRGRGGFRFRYPARAHNQDITNTICEP